MKLSEHINEKLVLRLIQEEGLKKKPYRCSAGKLTIGVGRNLEEKGLSQEEALFLLQNDIKEAIADLNREFSFFNSLNEARKIVLIDMCFNMGIARLKNFKKMIASLEKQDFVTASKEMLSSLWAKQVKNRATSLAKLMHEGQLN